MKSFLLSLLFIMLIALSSASTFAASKNKSAKKVRYYKIVNGKKVYYKKVKKSKDQIAKLKQSDSVSTRKSSLKKVSRKKIAPKKTQSVTTYKKAPFRKYTENLNFNYFVQYLGRSLSDNYQDGATYNRFKTGQDLNGNDLDSTASYQMFHSISIGYNLSQDYKLSWGYTFQDDLNKDIQYKSKNFDGSSTVYTRAKGISDNNKRISLFVSNVINNQYINLSTNYFYEFASTIASESEEREYGLGFEPNLGIKTGISGLYTGITGSIQRNYFKQQQYNGTFYNTYTQKVDTYITPTKYQTMLIQLGTYANYVLNDYVTLKSSLSFDWDQDGDEVNSTEIYNKNMDDVGRLGVDVMIDYGMVAGTFIEFGLEEASLTKTAIGATLSISLY